MKFKLKLWPSPPTALDMATQAYQEAQRDRLLQTKLREYHAAMEQMLYDRIVRLREDIRELSGEAK